MAEVEDRGPQLRAVCTVLLTVTILSSLLRCYTRLGIVKAFGLDDWLMMLANVSAP
jgi:hypothetical protein